MQHEEQHQTSMNFLDQRMCEGWPAPRERDPWRSIDRKPNNIFNMRFNQPPKLQISDKQLDKRILQNANDDKLVPAL